VLDGGTGNIGIGLVAPTAKLHVDQSSPTGNRPVATFDQADVSEEFTRYIGTAAEGVLTQSLVDNGDVGSAALIGWEKVYIEDIGNRITDGSYYRPFYSLSA